MTFSGLVLKFLLIISIISVISAQIVFDDGDGKPAEVVGHGDEDNQQASQDNFDDYYDELTNGRRIRDPEKYNRQKGCLCNLQFKDPHCGTDMLIYDNGCYFECAQKRNPRLTLRNWGPCL